MSKWWVSDKRYRSCIFLFKVFEIYGCMELWLRRLFNIILFGSAHANISSLQSSCKFALTKMTSFVLSTQSILWTNMARRTLEFYLSMWVASGVWLILFIESNTWEPFLYVHCDYFHKLIISIESTKWAFIVTESCLGMSHTWCICFSNHIM